MYVTFVNSSEFEAIPSSTFFHWYVTCAGFFEPREKAQREPAALTQPPPRSAARRNRRCRSVPFARMLTLRKTEPRSMPTNRGEATWSTHVSL